MNAKWYSGLQSALVAKWAIFWTVVSGDLSQAFLNGAFATPQSAAVYVKAQWWSLLISGVFGIIVGGAVKAQTKVNYINRVEAGTAPPPPVPVVAPAGATVVTPAKPDGGNSNGNQSP